MIEDHAEELTRALVQNLQSNPRTESYHQLSQEAIHHRAYNVYKNLGSWLNSKAEEDIKASYTQLGTRREAESVPISEVVYALILTKYHLRDYIGGAGLVDSAVDLYQEQELHRLLGQFFDKAIYYTVRAYERGVASSESREIAKSVR
jgi:hypothetical protein